MGEPAAYSVTAPPKVSYGRPKGRSVVRSSIRWVAPMITSVPRQLLRITLWRFFVCAVRYVWFAGLLRRTRVLDTSTGDVSPNTISHNLRSMLDLAVERSLRLIQPLVSLERIRERVGDVKLLSIGARTEGELFNLYAFGFRKQNVTAIDLISYSPRVTLGDMHALDLADNSFDAVLVGWVLAYSDNRPKAVSEIVRVARPGALVAIGVEWARQSEDEIAQEWGYFPGSTKRISSVDDLLELFGEHVDRVFFSQDEQADQPQQKRGDLLLVFSVRK